VKPGIFFTDDPAFRGKPRELVAEDYVYAIKRYLDPNLRRGGDPQISDLIVGMRDVVEAARKPGVKMNYDSSVEGLRALDRYTLQLKLHEPYYPIMMTMLVDAPATRARSSRRPAATSRRDRWARDPTC
jgi:ABC-type transport system substrate-binding protein